MAASIDVDSTTIEAKLLASASKRLHETLDFEATVRAAARVGIPEFADWCAVDLIRDATLRRAAVAHADGHKQARAEELAAAYTPDPMARCGVPAVLRTGRSELLPDLSASELDGPGCQREAGWSACELGLTSGIIVPLLARGRILGAACFATGMGRPAYVEGDVALAEELAARCAVAIDNARLYRLACQAIEVRDTFLATVSHDLRTPLSTIGGQAQLLRRLAARIAPESTQLADGLTRITSTVTRMTRMIDELLDVTQLELGRTLELNRQPLDVAELTRRIVAEYQQRTDQHIIRLAGESELWGEWDRGRLERVLDNLLGNAVKYSPRGGVITVVLAREEDEGSTWAIMSVRDQGLGIPAADVERVFERFHRATNVGRVAGRGIGLSVTREIVEAHGGTISVESYEGQGSTFTVRLAASQV